MPKAGQDQVKTIKWKLKVPISSFVIMFDTNRENYSNVLILFNNSLYIRIGIFHATSIWQLLV